MYPVVQPRPPQGNLFSVSGNGTSLNVTTPSHLVSTMASKHKRSYSRAYDKTSPHSVYNNGTTRKAGTGRIMGQPNRKGVNQTIELGASVEPLEDEFSRKNQTI
jgi:hypothetical protein